MKSHKEWQEEWDEATEVLRALRATRQSAPGTVAPESMRKAECGCPVCIETRKIKAREPAATHLTADRLALVGVILSMLRDKLPSNAVRIAVEIEFADGGECKMESKA